LTGPYKDRPLCKCIDWDEDIGEIFEQLVVCPSAMGCVCRKLGFETRGTSGNHRDTCLYGTKWVIGRRLWKEYVP
jgi:hypothetical protein